MTFKAVEYLFIKNIRHQVFFIGNESPVSSTDLNQLAASFFNRKLRTVYVPAMLLVLIGKIFDIFNRFGEKPNIVSSQKVNELLPQYWICDTKSFIEATGFSEFTSIHDAVDETMHWYQDHHWF